MTIDANLRSIYQTAALGKTFMEYELSGQRITELKESIRKSEAGRHYVEMTVSRPGPVGFRDSLRRAFSWLPGVRVLSLEEQFYLSKGEVEEFPDFQRLQYRLSQAGINVEITHARGVYGVAGGMSYEPARICLLLTSAGGITEEQRQRIYKDPGMYGKPISGQHPVKIDMADFEKRFGPGGTATQPQHPRLLTPG